MKPEETVMAMRRQSDEAVLKAVQPLLSRMVAELGCTSITIRPNDNGTANIWTEYPGGGYFGEQLLSQSERFSYALKKAANLLNDATLSLDDAVALGGEIPVGDLNVLMVAMVGLICTLGKYPETEEYIRNVGMASFYAKYADAFHACP